jgi:hypothetical protein
MAQEKKLSEIANKVTPVEEDQQGKLSGGFAAFASNAADFSGGGGSNSNTNNAVSCSCSCTNTNNATGCSCG